VPTGHCDADPHDGGAVVRRRAGARPPGGLKVPRGGAVRGAAKLKERCEAAPVYPRRRPAAPHFLTHVG
jgi:hypothetical protein